jgi:acyl-coenzyme A thioesterase 9
LREGLNPHRLANQPQLEVQSKAPRDSYVEIIVGSRVLRFLPLQLPFATDPVLRGQYISPWGAIRYGRLFEDMDALAGNIAFM